MDAVSIVQLNVTTFEVALNVDGRSTVVCEPRQSGDPYIPPSPLACSSFLSFRAATVASMLPRRRADVDDHFAPLSSRLFTCFVHFDATFHLYFLSPFQLYIYFETRWFKADGWSFRTFRFLEPIRSCESISRMLKRKWIVTFSQLFEWKKVGK